MDQLFYAHLVPIDTVLAKLDQYELTDTEKERLENMILATFHHRMLEVILLHLPKEHHDMVVKLIAENPHNIEVMISLKTLNPEIEEHIIDAGHDLARDLQGLLINERGS